MSTKKDKKYTKEPFVVIIVPNFNGEAITFKGKPILYNCLKSLEKLTYRNYKIVIGDGDSTDRSEQLAKKFKLDFFRNRPNKGPIKNNNNTIKYVMIKYKPDYILWFNNDAIITDPKFLGNMVMAMENDKNAGIEGVKLLYPNGKIQHAGVIVSAGFRNRGRFEQDNGQYKKIEKIEAVTAAVCLYRCEMLKKIGLFDEIYNTSCEDVDLCVRATQNKYNVLYNGTTSAVHLEGFTIKGAGSPEAAQRDFALRQEDYFYFSLKNATMGSMIKSIGILFARAFVVMEDKEKTGKATTIIIRRNFLQNLKATFKAIEGGMKKEKEWKEVIKEHSLDNET
ncbi:MAG: glycosyltransferase [Candidatus Micrarchaeaceae archaeon]